MSETFQYLNHQSNGVRYASPLNINKTLTFTGTKVRIPGAPKGRPMSTVQNQVALNWPALVLPEGCTDKCDALMVNSSIRVSFSAPYENKESVLAAWESMKIIIDKALVQNNILAGFKPNAMDTFQIGT